jgi:hypothetical protein
MMDYRLLVVSGCGPTRDTRQERPGMRLSSYLADWNVIMFMNKLTVEWLFVGKLMNLQFHDQFMNTHVHAHL